MNFNEERRRRATRETIKGQIKMGFSGDNVKGFVLALLSSGFIGASFIIKKKGLRRAAAASGVRAGDLSIFFDYERTL